MKKVFFLLVSLIISATSFTQTKNENKNVKLIVYYFHATSRCPTCLSIESNTQKVLETYFKKELDNGTIKYNVLNSDDDENKAVCKKYEAFGSALRLVKIVNDKETYVNLTDFAFSCSLDNTENFLNGLKDKITELLK